MSLSNNCPTFTYIQGSGISVVYMNETYSVQSFYTNKKYIYWDVSNKTVLQTSNVMPERSSGRFLVLINDNGIATVVPSTSDDFRISFDGDNDETVRAKIFALYDKNKSQDDKFVLVEQDMNGIKQIIGGTEENKDGLVEKVSKLQQTSNELSGQVSNVEKVFNDDKEMRQLRDDLSKAIIKLNSSLALFDSELYTYFKDDEVSTEEKAKINSQLDIIEEEKNNLLVYFEKVRLICVAYDYSDKLSELDLARDELNNANKNLKDMLTTVISDSIVTPSEKTIVIDLIGKYGMRINNLKNIFDDIILLGVDGVVYEELAKISVKSNKIEMTVTDTVTENINSSINQSGNMIKNSNVLYNLDGFESLGGEIERYEYVVYEPELPPEEFIPEESDTNEPDGSNTQIPDGGSVGDTVEPVVPPEITLPELVGKTRIHFLYTASTGDCIFIQCDNGKNILIDSVDNRLYNPSSANSIDGIKRYIKSLGVDRIDYIINTHFHSDHAGGLDEIMSSFNVKDSFFIYKEFDNSKMISVETTWRTNDYKLQTIQKAKEKSMKLIIPTEKQRFTIDSNTYFEVYNTTYIDYDNYNSSSLVIYFIHKNKKYLFLGDITPVAQERIYETLPNNVDVVKDAHHGYNKRISPELIRHVNPTDVVVTRNYPFDTDYYRACNSVGMWQSYNKNIYTLFKTGTHIVITCTGYDYTFNTSSRFYFEKCWHKFNDDNSKWCYFKKGGKYARNESLILDNKGKYNFDNYGYCTNPYNPE